MCLQWCRNEHNSLCSCCRMNWTWRIRTGRPCSLCLMRRNGRSTAARRRWVGLCLIVPNISSNLWLALSWLAAWSHSLELNCQQRMLLKAASYQNSFWKSLPRFLSLYWRKHMHLLCQLFLFFLQPVVQAVLYVVIQYTNAPPGPVSRPQSPNVPPHFGASSFLVLLKNCQHTMEALEHSG